MERYEIVVDDEGNYCGLIPSEKLQAALTPAGQRWTREKPTVPGWYWYRGSFVLEADGVEVVHVFEDDEALFAETVNNYSEPVSDFDGEWQGPLTPNEATG